MFPVDLRHPTVLERTISLLLWLISQLKKKADMPFWVFIKIKASYWRINYYNRFRTVKFTFFGKRAVVLILITNELLKLQQREIKGSDFRLVWLKNVLFPVSALLPANDISFNRSQLLPRFINASEYFFSICLHTKLHGCYAIKLCQPFYIFKQTPKLLMNPGYKETLQAYLLTFCRATQLLIS